MNLEPKAKAYLDAFAAANLPPMHQLSPAAARAMAQSLRRAGPVRAMEQVNDHRIVCAGRSVLLRSYVPPEPLQSCMLYLHGGGWMLGSIDESDAFARELAWSARSVVVSVGYALAPEYPFPAGFEDALAALTWVANTRPFGMASLPLGVFGDSAGANLAAAVADSAIGRASLAFQILACPVTDAGMCTGSFGQFANGTVLTAAMMDWFWQHYAPDEQSRADIRASPLRSRRMAGLPPAFVLTAENDVLRDEGELYAAALADADVPVVAKRYSGQIHNFLTQVGLFNGGADALNDVATFVAAQM